MNKTYKNNIEKKSQYKVVFQVDCPTINLFVEAESEQTAIEEAENELIKTGQLDYDYILPNANWNATVVESKVSNLVKHLMTITANAIQNILQARNIDEEKKLSLLNSNYEANKVTRNEFISDCLEIAKLCKNKKDSIATVYKLQDYLSKKKVQHKVTANVYPKQQFPTAKERAKFEDWCEKYNATYDRNQNVTVTQVLLANNPTEAIMSFVSSVPLYVNALVSQTNAEELVSDAGMAQAMAEVRKADY